MGEEIVSSSFVFENSKTMGIVCGVNDSNVSYMEKLLNTSLNVRGTRIENSGTEIDSDKDFITLMEKLVNLSKLTDSIGENEILMEYRSITDSISDSSEKEHITIGTNSIFPKSKSQEEYIRAMKRNQIVFAIGPAGTGKTFLAVNYALGQLFAGKIRKIILTRPVVEAGESLGFLPGDLSQKLNPYLKPLYDSMESTVSPATVKRLEETGQIEIAPLAYMRGRSINNSCIILDEAQNTTRGQMKMFLTRIGENSSAFITGDITQTDLPEPSSSGLRDAYKRLKNIDGLAFVEFSASDAVRSRIVRKIIEAYDEK